MGVQVERGMDEEKESSKTQNRSSHVEAADEGWL